MTGVKEKSGVVREALKALIERESARRLARLGGGKPDVDAEVIAFIDRYALFGHGLSYILDVD
jgi:hypothetical protein